MRRRFLSICAASSLAAGLTGACAGPAQALQAPWPAGDGDGLSPRQSTLFRAWFTLIVDQQIRRGPTPRWTQRDCAGLVRFAADNALREHTVDWLKANGLAGAGNLPPEIALDARQRSLTQRWMRADGTRGPYASAISLVQDNSRFVSRDINQALPVDLLFYDQGDDQHLMIWLDRYIAYHTGTTTPTDNGLRAVSVSQLMHWKDSRWRPIDGNPNFIGLFRLGFLAP
ncbi:DUF1175 domain-containing protein [Bordetella sp. FB-8]|uniref:DUF1175 domain-containing protein n=1 Tax=Bordetella sp. FB-8 TaxID=1159870 RepID=UPI00037B8C3C|nr:DUF1175 family protein [Bordetella sp. FB-8]